MEKSNGIEKFYTWSLYNLSLIHISFTRAYLVEGNYGYADGLYANGDEVTVQSKTAGLFGTAANGKFRIRLPAGTHSVILTSARFEAIGFDAVSYTHLGWCYRSDDWERWIHELTSRSGECRRDCPPEFLFASARRYCRLSKSAE